MSVAVLHSLIRLQSVGLKQARRELYQSCRMDECIYLCRSNIDRPKEETGTEEVDEHSCWSA
jgi:hypothetical protein